MNKTKTMICDKHGEYTSKLINILGKYIPMGNCPTCVAEYNKKLMEAEHYKESDKLKIERQDLINRGVSLRYLNNQNNFKYVNDFLSLQTGDIVVSDFFETTHNNFKYDDSILIYGGCGVGKSFFAYKLVEIAYHKRLYYSIHNIDYFVSIYKNGDHIKWSFENIQNIFEDDECIIVDEIDNAKDELSLKVLDMLVSWCYDCEKRLILIGNGSFDLLDNIFTNKALSRINSTFKIINGWNLKDLRNCN